MHPEGKPVIRLVIIEKAETFYDEMKTADRCTFRAVTITCKNLVRYMCCLIINLEYFIIQHLLSPMGAQLKEFYCISLFLQASVRIIHSNRP
jgi:hypothetical protein